MPARRLSALDVPAPVKKRAERCAEAIDKLLKGGGAKVRKRAGGGSRRRTAAAPPKNNTPIFIGVGAVIASALPWIMTNWFEVSNTAPAGEIPESVKIAFYVGGAAFLLAVSWTVFRSREYSPEQLAEFSHYKGVKK